jgi:hypothetical protein
MVANLNCSCCGGITLQYTINYAIGIALCSNCLINQNGLNYIMNRFKLKEQAKYD